METSLPLLRVLSLGAGVQSSALYLMAVHGEFPGETPDLAIFADTQWEPPATYAWLDELERIGGSKIPIRRVTIGNLRDDVVSGAQRGYRMANIPYFAKTPDGKKVLLRRTCTSEYKLTPLARETRKQLDVVRARLGVRGLPPGAVEQWIGISTDEASRAKDARVKYVKHVFPLLDRGMSRKDCISWLGTNGYKTPTKSACIGCPFHDDAFWEDLKTNHPVEWEDACSFDEHIRRGAAVDATGTLRGMRNGGEAFLHASCTPLRTVVLRPKIAAPNLFENECEGMCGV